MNTVLQRVHDNRTLTSPHVTYGEAAGHRWLITAEAHNLNAAWPGHGADTQIDAVIALAEQALTDRIIEVNPATIDHVQLERIADKELDGVLAGFRLLVTTTSQITLTTTPMWASDATKDERALHGALNALWTMSWEIHDLMEALARATAPPAE
jgi:hypothetical protein